MLPTSTRGPTRPGTTLVAGFGLVWLLLVVLAAPAGAVSEDGGSTGIPWFAYVVVGAVVTWALWKSAGRPKRAAEFTRGEVALKTLSIVLYFTVATVFIPSVVVESSILATAPSMYADRISADGWSLIRDLIATTVWLVAVAFGFWALRRAQRRDVI